MLYFHIIEIALYMISYPILHVQFETILYLVIYQNHLFYFYPLFRIDCLSHSRSRAGIISKNRKTEIIQRKRKAYLKKEADLAKKEEVIAKKDKVINKMEKDIVTYKKTVDSLHRQQVKHMQKPCFVTSSAIARSCINKATTRTLGKDTLTARDALIRTLSGIPNFSAEDVTVDCDEVGKGQFGTVKTALLHKLEMTVVAKVIIEKCKKKLSWLRRLLALLWVAI